MVLVEGEPGVGKTRLAEEVTIEAAARGFLAVWGRCVEGGGAPPLWPWAQVLRAAGDDRDIAGLVPERGRLDPQVARGQLNRALADLLGERARDRPLLLVLDDLQWADGSARESSSTPRSSAHYSCQPQSRCSDGGTGGCRARSLALAMLRPFLKDLPVLADSGYEGAGCGVHVPVKNPAGGQERDLDTRTRNALLRSLRCLGEQGFALMSQRWRTLQRVMLSPGKIGDIAQAALVLVQFEHNMITSEALR